MFQMRHYQVILIVEKIIAREQYFHKLAEKCQRSDTFLLPIITSKQK